MSLLKLWGVGVAASVLVTGASAMGYLESPQARALDLLLWLQGRQPATEVVIVAVGEGAFESLGYRQPLPRDYLARLIRGLQRSGAAVVGVDIVLNSPTTPAEDAALARAVLEFSEGGVSRVVVADAPGPRGGPLADPFFLRAVVRGSPAVPVDDDGLIRRAGLVIPRRDAGPEPALSLAIVARLGGMNQEALRAVLGHPAAVLAVPVWRPGVGWSPSGSAPVAVRPGELLRINFAGPAKTFLKSRTRPLHVYALLEVHSDGRPRQGGN